MSETSEMEKESPAAVHTVEEMRLKRLAFFDQNKGQSQTKEWNIEHPPSREMHYGADNDRGHPYVNDDGNGSKKSSAKTYIRKQDEGIFYQKTPSQDEFHNIESSMNARQFNAQLNHVFPSPPQYSSQLPGHWQRRKSDLTENGPVPLKSKKSTIGMSRSSALSSSMGQLSLSESKDSAGFSVFRSRPDLDDLGLSTHRPDSEVSARSIQGEIYIPSNQGSGKTPKQIFSHKTQEELYSALGDEKMEALMSKVTHDIGELKQGRSQAQNSGPHQGYQNILGKTREKGSNQSDEERGREFPNSKFDPLSPRQHSLAHDTITSKDYRSLLVQNHDQVTLPKSARNSFSSEEIYRQAYGDGMMFERSFNRGFSPTTPFSYRQPDKPNDQSSHNDGQYALNSARSSMIDYPNQLPIRHPLHQGYSHPFSYPPPSIPPTPFDGHHHQFHHQSPHSSGIPISPQSSYSSASFPHYMQQPPPYSSHNHNNPPHPYPIHPHPFFHDPHISAQYNHMYGVAQTQGRTPGPAQSPPVVNSSMSPYPYNQSFSSPHYGSSRVSGNPGVSTPSSIEHQAMNNNMYPHGQASQGSNQSADYSLSQSGGGLKIPRPPSNPPALQGKEDSAPNKTKPLEHRRVTVPPTSTQQAVTSSATPATGNEFKSFNLQRYFSSMELRAGDSDKISTTEIPQSSRSVEGDYYKQNADIDDNATIFTNMSGVTSATKAVGLTSRLQELGVDLDHLKHLKVIDGQGGSNKTDGNQEISFDAYAKSIRRCPECKTANKAYMDWCVECGEVLIGVELSLPSGKKKQIVNNTSITAYDNNKINGSKSRSRSRSGTREKGREVIGGNQNNLDVLRFTADDRRLRRESPESGKGLSLHSSPARNKMEQEDILESKDSGRASNGEGRDQYLDVPSKRGQRGEDNIEVLDDDEVNEEEEFYGEEEGVEYIYEDVESNIFEQISDPILRDFIISYRNRQVSNNDPIIMSTSASLNIDDHSNDQRDVDEGNHEQDGKYGSRESNLYNIDEAGAGLYDEKEVNSNSQGGAYNDGAGGQHLKSAKSLEYRNKSKNVSPSSYDNTIKPITSDINSPKVKKKSGKKKKKPGHEAIDIEIFGYEESRLSRSSNRGCNIVPSLNLATSSDEEEEEDEESSEEEDDDDNDNEVEDKMEEMQVESYVEQPAKNSSLKKKAEPIVSHQNTFKKTKEMLASKSTQGHPQPLPSKSQSGVTVSKSRSRLPSKEENGVTTSTSSTGTAPGNYQRHWVRSSVAWSSYNQRELNTRSSLTNLPHNKNGDKPSSARSSVDRENLYGDRQGGTSLNTNTNNSNSGRPRPSSADYERRKPVYSQTRNMNRPSSAKVNSETNTKSSSPVPAPKRNNYLTPSPAQAKREKSPVVKQKINNRSTSLPQRRSSPSPTRPQEDVSANQQVHHPSANNVNNNNVAAHRGQEDDSLHDLCPEFHRLPHDLEEQTETADKMHAIAKSGYDRFHELTPRIQDGDVSLWQCLPDEVWLYILTFLSQSDLCHLMMVSKGFCRLTNDQSLWRYITVRPHFNLTDATLTSIISHHPISLAMVKCQGHDLSTNALQDFFKQTEGRLKELNICGCSHGALVGSVVLETAAKFCRALTHLDASFCNINDASFTAIVSCCDRLESVCINGFQFMSDTALLTLVKKHGTSLHTLELYACFSLSATVLRNLGEYCHNLRRLCLGGCNKLTASTMITLSTLLSRVEELDLRGCRNLKNECIRKIVRNCPRIHTLVLANCQQISNPALVEMGTYLKSTLRIVDVCGCNLVTDEGVVSLVKNCDRLTSLDISSTGCMHSSLSAIAISGCSRWIETLKLSFLSGISEANLSNLLRHCPRLKLIHTFGCSSLRNLTRLRDMKPGVTIEGDVEVPRMSFQ